MEEKAVPQPK